MITFGITTDGNDIDRLCNMIRSILIEVHDRINYEILLVGMDNNKESIYNIRCIPFDSKNNPGEICKKKNIITKEAKYDTIVYSHDYISFAPGWLNGWLEFSVQKYWDIGMNVLLTQDGQRFRDWCSWSDYRHGTPWVQHEPWCPPEGIKYDGKPCLVPYDYSHTDRMYISGTYWIAKRKIMLDNPLREDLKWGQAEDVEFSLRVLKDKKYKYLMNTNSVCRLLKQKDVILPLVDLKNE